MSDVTELLEEIDKALRIGRPINFHVAGVTPLGDWERHMLERVSSLLTSHAVIEIQVLGYALQCMTKEDKAAKSYCALVFGDKDGWGYCSFKDHLTEEVFKEFKRLSEKTD